MSHFTLKQDGYTSYTAIPNCFIEQYMPYAAGEFVKIYIYLLKCVRENRSELSISRIADVFNNTEKDVVRALKYWQKKGLLSLTFDDDNALTSLRIMSLADSLDESREPEAQKVTLNVTDAPVPGQPGINTKHSAAVRPEEKPAASDKVPSQAPVQKEYSAQQIRQFSEQEDIKMLFFAIQKYLGRPLTGQDTNTVLYLYEELHFSTELIEYLFEYCVSRDKRNIRYIEKTALGWAEEGIRSVKAAKSASGIYTKDCYHVLSAFGLSGRQPTRSESEYVSRWILSYGFDMPVILKACSKTMNQIHNPSFEYTDSILKNWKAHGVSSLEDVQKLDEAFELSGRSKTGKSAADSAGSGKTAAVNSRFNNFSQRTYDYKALEQKLRTNN